MVDIFQFAFMQRALLAGTIIGVLAPCVGMFLVVRRYSYLGDTLAHVSLLGVVVAVMFGFSPIAGAAITSVAAAGVIEVLRDRGQLWGETILSLVLSGSLAFALILMSIGNARGIGVTSILFGSITTLTTGDVWLMFGLALTVLVTIILLFDALFLTSFHEALATAEGVPTKQVNRIFAVLASLVVALSLQTLGVLLIGALMVIPVLTAMIFGRGFKQTIILGIIFSLVSVHSGLVGSYIWNTPSGPTIVAIAVAIFSVAFLGRSFFHLVKTPV